MEIRNNNQYGSKEVYFDGKPNEAIRTALKDLKFRWNPKKSCWYGFAEEHKLISIINENGETAVTDGYLGGGAVYGAKSNQFLYGADLSAAIRTDLKAAGIKNASVKVKTYSGGQSITVTVKTVESDFIPLAEFIKNYKVHYNCWIYYGENCESIHADKYFNLPGEEQERIRVEAAKFEYTRSIKGETINNYHIDTYTAYTPEFLSQIHKIDDIVKAFRYDDSNSMVDYFDTNFYYDICTKGAAA